MHCVFLPDSRAMAIVFKNIVLQVPSSGNTEVADAFTGSYLVELSIVTAHCHDQIQDDIKNFADQLKPYPLTSDIIYLILSSVWLTVNTV